jgi:hypothetical protein
MASLHDHDVDQGSSPAAKADWIRDIHLELQSLADPVQATYLGATGGRESSQTNAKYGVGAIPGIHPGRHIP